MAVVFAVLLISSVRQAYINYNYLGAKQDLEGVGLGKDDALEYLEQNYPDMTDLDVSVDYGKYLQTSLVNAFIFLAVTLFALIMFLETRSIITRYFVRRR